MVKENCMYYLKSEECFKDQNNLVKLKETNICENCKDFKEDY